MKESMEIALTLTNLVIGIGGIIILRWKAKKQQTNRIFARISIALSLLLFIELPLLPISSEHYQELARIPAIFCAILFIGGSVKSTLNDPR